jgi:hypothetical protein
MLMLEFYDDVTDGGTIKQAKYDLSKDVGLPLSPGFPGYNPTGLAKYRSSLYAVEHCQAAP